MPSGTDQAETGVRTRRRRPKGEPRRLIVAAARDVFNRKGYASASTREIATQADVSETLIFRYFGTKAGLFREAMVRPFVETIDRWVQRGPDPASGQITREDTTAFVGDMYNVFREHRALAALVFAADALAESEVAESGAIDDVRAAVDRFVNYAREQAQMGGAVLDPRTHDLAIRGHMAMVAGVATFGPWYFGTRRPSQRAVIQELSEWVWLRYSQPSPKASKRGAGAASGRRR